MQKTAAVYEKMTVFCQMLMISISNLYKVPKKSTVLGSNVQ